ncbi:MAG: low molecular weight phosphotyrosine protein phosphatase [Sphingopyxis sp.]|nr:low molecular weight phosphotyrosine protein phosphatase [Sphingopyxis sp.]
MQSILFLCLGNICRSPLAEGAARTAFASARLPVALDSAGTGDWHVGHPPDTRARAIAKRHGTDIGDRAGAASDRGRLPPLRSYFGGRSSELARSSNPRPTRTHARLALMLDMVPGREGQAVADPYYGNADDFAACWADVIAVADALVAAKGKRATG